VTQAEAWESPNSFATTSQGFGQDEFLRKIVSFINSTINRFTFLQLADITTTIDFAPPQRPKQRRALARPARRAMLPLLVGRYLDFSCIWNIIDIICSFTH